MIIFDGEAAVVGIEPDNNSIGAMVHHSKAVLRIAVGLYEHYWQSARPLVELAPSDQGELTAQESELLRLLVHGGTDEQVARKLCGRATKRGGRGRSLTGGGQGVLV